jgi:hypothetical protein
MVEVRVGTMSGRIRSYGKRVGYTDAEMATFAEGGHRVRQVTSLSKAAPLCSIEEDAGGEPPSCGTS